MINKSKKIDSFISCLNFLFDYKILFKTLKDLIKIQWKFHFDR